MLPSSLIMPICSMLQPPLATSIFQLIVGNMGTQYRLQGKGWGGRALQKPGYRLYHYTYYSIASIMLYSSYEIM